MPTHNAPFEGLSLKDVETCISDGMWDWRPKENVEYYSPAFFEVLGYDPKGFESTPESWQKLIHPDDKVKALKAFHDHVEHGEPYNLPVRYKHKDGHWSHIICRGMVVDKDADDIPLRMIGIHQDITPLVESQVQRDAALRALVAAEDASSEKNLVHIAAALILGCFLGGLWQIFL